MRQTPDTSSFAKYLSFYLLLMLLSSGGCASGRNEAALDGAWILPNSLGYYGAAFLLTHGKAKLWTYSITRPQAPVAPFEGSYHISGDQVTIVIDGVSKPYVYYIRSLEGKTRLVNEIYFAQHKTVDVKYEGDFLERDTEFSESKPFAFQQRWHDQHCSDTAKTTMFSGCH